MLKIVNEPPIITGTEIPPPLKSALLRALEKSPATRYAKASEFGRALKAVKSTLPLPPETGAILIDRRARKKAAAPPQHPEAPDHAAESGRGVQPGNTARWLLLAAVIAALAIVAIAAYALTR